MLDRLMNAFRSRPWLFAALVGVLLLIANLLVSPGFLKPARLPATLATLSPMVLVAFASTPAIVAGKGGLDLSVGPLAVLVNVIFVHSLSPNDLGSLWIALPILLLLGTAVGAISGVLIGYFRYIPIIATLCMSFVVTGISLNIGSVPKQASSNWMTDLGDMVGPIPGGLILMAVPVLLWYGLSRTSYHRALYAAGGNDTTAFSAGVDVRTARVIAYALGGLFAAFGGIAITAITQTSVAGQSGNYLLIGLVAVALGGLPLFGGRGGLTNAFWGAVVLYLIQTLLSNLTIDPSWNNVVYGGLLLVGVLVGAAVLMQRPPRMEQAS